MSQKLLSSLPQILGVVFLVALAFLIWNNPGARNSNRLAAVGTTPFSLGSLSSESGNGSTLFAISCPWVSSAQLQSSAPQLSSCKPAACPESSTEVADAGCVVTSLGTNGGNTTPIHTAGSCSRICSTK
ncbi:MAG: hypothetical protein Q7R48_00160 [bacterium]|nr:hypothetical protein [bacterium]